MEGEPGIQAGVVPPLPVEAPPTAAPPPLPAESKPPARPGRHFLAVLLSLGLGLFLADAFFSLIDASLGLLFDIHPLSLISGLVSGLALLLMLLIYALMAFTAAVPKRVFLPMALFTPAAGLVMLWFSIYFYSRIQWVVWAITCVQVILGLGVLHWAQGGFKFRWPLVAESRLTGRGFSGWNFFGFLLANLFLLLPAVMVYLVVCAHLAVGHFSDGFMALRREGFTVQVRKYARNDGKTIELVPMSHIGEPEFYQALSQSFPTNAIILMEGVSDNQNLLTNKITYQRMAASLGVAEQHEAFKPRGQVVRADVDIAEFTTNTIAFLNLAMLVHSKGLDQALLMNLAQYSPPPHFEEQLFDDLLHKRNRHLLKEIADRLPDSENLIVPWGVAHMPEIGREIQKTGFHLVETREYVAIRFGGGKNKRKDAAALEGRTADERR